VPGRRHRHSSTSTVDERERFVLCANRGPRHRPPRRSARALSGHGCSVSRDGGTVTYVARDTARWLRAGPMREWRRRAGGEWQWGWGGEGEDSYAGGIACKQRCRRALLLGVLITRHGRDCEQAGSDRAQPPRTATARTLRGDATRFFGDTIHFCKDATAGR
jgi:hypothetical protein